MRCDDLFFQETTFNLDLIEGSVACVLYAKIFSATEIRVRQVASFLRKQY